MNSIDRRVLAVSAVLAAAGITALAAAASIADDQSAVAGNGDAPELATVAVTEDSTTSVGPDALPATSPADTTITTTSPATTTTNTPTTTSTTTTSPTTTSPTTTTAAATVPGEPAASTVLTPCLDDVAAIIVDFAPVATPLPETDAEYCASSTDRAPRAIGVIVESDAAIDRVLCQLAAALEPPLRFEDPPDCTGGSETADDSGEPDETEER